MAKAPLKYEDLAEKNVLRPLINQFKELDKQTETTLKALKAIGKASAEIAQEQAFEDTESINKFTKATKQAEDASESFTDTERKQIKVMKDLRELRGDEAKQLAIAKEQLRLQRKELRDNAKAVLSNDDAYARLSKRFNESQKRLKQVAAEFGINSKEAKAARKEFDKVADEIKAIDDAARDGRRNVGRYAQSVEKLGNKLKALGAASVILQGLNMLKDSFRSNEAVATGFDKTLGAVTVTLGIFVKTVVQASKGADTFWGFIQNLNSGFEDFNSQVLSAVEANNKAIDMALENTRALSDLDLQIAKTEKSLTKFTGTADNDAQTMNDRAAALRNAIKQQRELTETNIRAAVKEQELAKQRAIAAVGTHELMLETGEVITTTTDAYAAYQNATAAVLRAENEGQQANLDLTKEYQMLQLDITDQRLDFFIDVSDAAREANEIVIDSDRSAFSERRKLLADNQAEAQKAFMQQIETINKQQRTVGAAQLELDKLFTDTDNTVLQSTDDIIKYLESIGSERLNNRAREVLMDRVRNLKEQEEAVRDLQDQETEYENTLEDIALLEEAINKTKMKGADIDQINTELAKQRTQTRIEQIDRELMAVENASQKQAELNQEKNELILEQEISRVEKELEANEKLTKERAERIAEALEAIDKLSKLYFERRIERTENELEKETDRQERLIELAEQGNELAEQNLAASQKRQAELERQRIEQQKQQQQAELALASLKTYTAKVEAGSERPFVETVTEIGLLTQFISSLPAFKEGAERVGDKTHHRIRRTGTDDHLALVNEGERIVPADVNTKLGDISNLELPAAVALYKANTKMVDQVLVNQPMASVAVNSEISNLLKEIRDQPRYLGRDYDSTRKAVIEAVETKNKIIRNHYSNKGFK